MRIILTILILISATCAYADTTKLLTLHKQKRYDQIVKLLKNKKFVAQLGKKDFAVASYALRKKKKYQDDTRLISQFLKKFYSKEHKEISYLIKNKKPLRPESYPVALKTNYWYLYSDLATMILSSKTLSPQIEKKKIYFDKIRTILLELEFREVKVENKYSKVSEHLQSLKNDQYTFVKSFYLQYVSWQNSSSLVKSPTNSITKLILTNTGTCVGGDIGIQNAYYEFSIDGCFIFGSSQVSTTGSSGITYEQTIPTYGIKIGPQFYKIVSSTKSKIGISFPLLYANQQLSEPLDTDYKVLQESSLSFMVNISSKWQMDNWYIKTEFGHFIQKQSSIWSLGLGRSF